jgi:hypothetical protein
VCKGGREEERGVRERIDRYRRERRAERGVKRNGTEEQGESGVDELGGKLQVLETCGYELVALSDWL